MAGQGIFDRSVLNNQPAQLFSQSFLQLLESQRMVAGLEAFAVIPPCSMDFGVVLDLSVRLFAPNCCLPIKCYNHRYLTGTKTAASYILKSGYMLQLTL